MPDFVTGERRNRQAADEIVIETERSAVKAGSAMMMVVERTIVIVLVTVM